MELTDLLFKTPEGQSFRLTQVEEPLISQLAQDCHREVVGNCYHGICRHRDGNASHQVLVNGPLGGKVAEMLTRQGHCYDVLPTADPSPHVGPFQIFYSTHRGLEQLAEREGISVTYQKRPY